MKLFPLILSAGLALSLATACGTEFGATERQCSTTPGPEMRPGWNCLSCHRDGGQARDKVWTAGGTVYDTIDSEMCDGIPEAEVVFFAPTGEELLRVATNEAGNFFTSEPLPEGFRVGVARDGKLAMMPIPPPAGSCNACHSASPLGGAKGVIYAP